MERGKQRIRLVPEETYAQVMRGEVEPWLESLREQGRLRDELYYELFPLPDAKATVVISHGSTESCEKYHEMIYYFLQHGYSCAIMDHRGHGHSVRDGRSGKGTVHISRFQKYVRDFHRFVHEEVIPMADGTPLYLFAHSMGGGIAALYLEQYPEDFDKAVLSSPMLGLDTGSLPAWAGSAADRLMSLVGQGGRKLWFQGKFDPEVAFEDEACTSFARFRYYQDIRCAEPDYQLSGNSYRWTGEAIRATEKARKNVSSIRIPVLVFQAEKDGFVSPNAQVEFVCRLKQGRLIHVSGSKHEIYRSENEVLQGYLKEVFRFYDRSC